MSMDYNKLMDELDKEVLGSFKPAVNPVGLSATESYDEVEAELMAKLGDKSPIVEVEGEEDLVFDDETREDGVESPEEIFIKAVNDFLSSLMDSGLKTEEAVTKIKDLVSNTLSEPEEEVQDGDDVQEDEGDSDSKSSTEGEGMTEENFTEDPEKQKELFNETIDNLAEEKDLNKAIAPANESVSFEEYQRDKEAKMLNRYKQLANKDQEKRKIAIEGLGEVDISIDDRAISRVSGEYGYSGNNLRRMVAEALHKGVI